MPKERNKADDYREKAYAGDTKAMNNLGVCYERGIGLKMKKVLFAFAALIALTFGRVCSRSAEHKRAELKRK